MTEPAEPDDDGHVYSVRPEPPQFDDLIRRPALFNNESTFGPPGRSCVGSVDTDYELCSGPGSLYPLGAVVVLILR